MSQYVPHPMMSKTDAIYASFAPRRKTVANFTGTTRSGGHLHLPDDACFVTQRATYPNALFQSIFSPAVLLGFTFHQARPFVPPHPHLERLYEERNMDQTARKGAGDSVASKKGYHDAGNTEGSASKMNDHNSMGRDKNPREGNTMPAGSKGC